MSTGYAEAAAPPRTLALHDLLSETARTHGSRAAISTPGVTLTYEDAERGARRVAQALVAGGLKPGDRVAFLADEAAVVPAILVGTAKAGGVLVPLNWRLSPLELLDILADCGAAALFASTALLAQLDTAAVAAIHQVIDIAGLAEWLAAAPNEEPDVPHHPEDVVLQIYTSGTTGRPKGVMLTDRNLANSVPGLSKMWGLSGESVMLAVLPMFHVAGVGVAIGALWSTSTLAVPVDASAPAIISAIEKHRVTHVVMASVMLQRMLTEAIARGSAVDLTSLELVGYGAAPISPHIVADAMRHLKCSLLQVYGLTESTGTLTVLEPVDHELDPATIHRLGSCGRPVAEIELKLVDPESGLDVATGAVGEIWARGPRVMLGYWGNPVATADTVTREGWLRTGDLAWQDADGFVYLCDRLRDMIVTGGENVYPAEVEDVLAVHPDVLEVAVVGVPSDRWGESPHALVVLRPGAQATPADLVTYARDRLAHYKCPRAVSFVGELPRNPSGKVLRRLLREPFWAGIERRVN